MKMPVSADQDIFPHFKYLTGFFFNFIVYFIPLWQLLLEVL